MTRSAAEAVRLLADRGWTLATCESLTAGLVAATIADVPGASAVLRGGLVCYATDLKATLAGVDPQVLARHGAVAEPTVRQMAAGAAARLGSDVGLATTGVAGPDPAEGHPPGHVWIAAALPDATTVRLLDLSGDRAAIRSGTVDAVLDLLAELLVGAGVRRRRSTSR